MNQERKIRYATDEEILRWYYNDMNLFGRSDRYVRSFFEMDTGLKLNDNFKAKEKKTDE